MSKTLNELKQVLLEGQRRTMQGSYQRRSPAKKAVPFLREARTGLREFVQQNGDNAEAWRLLSQAEECLLNYRSALTCLERAIALSGRKDKKDMKKLALLKEAQAEWADVNLNRHQLDDLGRHLRERLAENGCDHSLRFTDEWLLAKQFASPERVIEGLGNQVGYCDCNVVAG